MDELLAKMVSLDDYMAASAEKTIRKILREVRIQIVTDTSEATKTAFDKYTNKIVKAVSEVSMTKASENAFYSSYANYLASKLSKENIHLPNLRLLSRCRLVIARSSKFNMAEMHINCMPWFEKIRNLNPQVRWHMEDVTEADIEPLSSSPGVVGLKGDMIVALSNREGLHSLNVLCGKCHATLRIKLYACVTNPALVRRLMQYTPILQRLNFLSVGIFPPDAFDFEDDPYSSPPPHWSTEVDYRALDIICRDYKPELKLDVESDSQPLRRCLYVPQCLTDLTLCSPTLDDIYWLDEYGRYKTLRLGLHEVDNIELVRKFTAPTCILRNLEIVHRLRGEDEISLLIRICRANRKLQFSITMDHQDLQHFFRQKYPKDIHVFVFDSGAAITSNVPSTGGLGVECDANFIRHLAGVDLASARALKVILSGEYPIDSSLVSQVFKRCIRLQDMTVQINERKRPLGNFLDILQEAVKKYWKHLKLFIAPLNYGFSEIDLPGFDRKKRADQVFRHRIS